MIGLHIIAMTANAMRGVREACLDADGTITFSTPVELSELERVLPEASDLAVRRRLGAPFLLRPTACDRLRV